ncbi:non-ribosomal peptide synthetase [Nocardia brevicatena]|uniref:non-ribosomal peptide synthetase n=1 Tax=Nocardia brevicatena TaxID=37327 RepID=UPI0002D4425A|nr:non-ribosomal peptide synthetase [Nocardia brevicatena]
MAPTRRSVRRVQHTRSRHPLFGQLLTAAVDTAFDAVAVRFDPTGDPTGRRELTYRELDEESSRLARHLIGHGVGPGDFVAVALPRSMELVLAVWAVAKTGAAYVPIDPTYPADRIAHMITDSGVTLGITVTTYHTVRTTTGVEWIELDDPIQHCRIAMRPAHPVSYADRLRPVTAQHIAYVIFTSGSTGRPKGVAVTHTGLAGLVESEISRRGVTRESRIVQLCSPSFDFSLIEMLLTFSAGATLVVPTVFGGAELTELLHRQRITHLFITPSVLESLDPSCPNELRTIVCGGDRLGPELVARWTRPGCSVHNLYGPTEATIIATGTDALTPGDPVHIGTAIPAMGTYILDTHLRPVPEGVVGELYLTGPALALGYIGRPALTAERFIANPFRTGTAATRMYRTGDLVRRTPTGELEYHGRVDFQVKIRGLRIELDEIDNALTHHPDIDYAATLGATLPSGAQALVSYVLPRAATGGGRVRPDTAELTDFLAKTLPAYMIPATIMVLDELPLTPVGKLDRTALPKPTLGTRRFRAPTTYAEQLVADTFAALLLPSDDRPVGADDDFFDLGGNSLLATQAVARIGTALGRRIPVAWLFDASTVSKLAARLDEQKDRSPVPAAAPRSMPRPERIPLSYAQQRMWFLNRFDPAAANNNIPLAVRLSGRLDVSALRAAIAELVARHEVLRTSYPEHDGIGSQHIHDPSEPDALPELTVHTVAETELAEQLATVVLQGFDVTAAPPIRVCLLRTSDTEHVLICVIHHIAGDGSSLVPLARDLMTAYSSWRAGVAPAWDPPALHYADYTLWQRELLGAEDDPDSLLAHQLEFWRDRLADLPETLDLPADRPRPSVFSGRGATYEFPIDVSLHAGLQRVAQQHDSTLFMVVHAAFALLLARLSGTCDIAVGTATAGRDHAALGDLIGMFVNTLAVRTDIDLDLSFAELLHQVRGHNIEALANADVPFERLVELLAPTRSNAYHPLFQVVFNFHNFAYPTLELPELTATALEPAVPLAKFDLELTVIPREQDRVPLGMSAAFTYATDLFDEATIAGFARRLTAVLTAVTESVDRPVGDIDLLDPAERATILHDWNTTRHPLSPGPILDAYRRAVDRYPDAPAIADSGTELAYREFDTQVNRLARVLIDRGVGAESLVALTVRRSVDHLVGMYAVLTAGGAYLPVDPDHPAERIAHVLVTARPMCVIGRADDTVPVPPDIPVLDLNTAVPDRISGTPLCPTELLRPLLPDHPAYVIFTSGSTGRPKGVLITHRAIHNHITWMLQRHPMGPGDVYLQKSPTAFDISFWGNLMPLASGAKLVVADRDGHRDPAYLVAAMAEHGVTATDFVPAMAEMVAAHIEPGSLPKLRDLFVGGEALPRDTVQAIHTVTDARVHNMYGPTETTVTVTTWTAGPDENSTVTIGRPGWNTRVYVLDSRLRSVPAGVPGELYVAGVQLARGYVQQPGTTAQRFVADPFGTGTRLYRTGDLVVWRAPDAGRPAVLDYLGRTDFQVQIRGRRIELGEIESVLRAQPTVGQAVATVLSSPGGDRLVAYVVPRSDETVDRRRLQTALAGALPDYMVPSAMVVLPELPVNASGKVDRRALPEPVFETAEYRPARTTAERSVADVFAELLGVERIGIDDDFFALGGNSLLATRAVARLNEALDTRIGVRDLFEAPRVAALAARLRPGAGTVRPPLVRLPRPDRVPLSLAQQRMWVLNRMDPDSAAYNLPFAIRLSGVLDPTALEHAVGDVLERHEVLRTRFPADADGLPYQETLPVSTVLPGGLPVEPGGTDEITDTLARVLSTGFDITAASPVRLRLFGSGEDHLLVIVVHHICADGASLAPLARDLVTAYTARSGGGAPEWAPLPVQYTDYTLWQHRVIGGYDDPDSVAARQLSYWRAHLAGYTGRLELPLDRPCPSAPSARGGSTALTVPARLHGRLGGIARDHNASLFMVFHAALAVLLGRISGSGDIVIGTPVAGRGERALDDLVGMFVNTLAPRTEIDPGSTFHTLLDQVRAADLSALAHADIPFERVVEEIAPDRSGTHPLVQVMLSFQNIEQPTLELPGLAVTAVDTGTVTAKFDLQVIVEPRSTGDGSPAEVEVVFIHATDLFDDSTVRALARRFERILSAVAADPAAAVGDIDILDSDEGRPLHTAAICHTPLRQFEPSATTLPELVGAQARLHPEATAVRFGTASVSFDALQRHANRIARALIATGAGPESLVAVAVPRTELLPIALLGVLTAGAAYLPIDLTYPAERLEFVLTDANPVCVLTTAEHRSQLPDTGASAVPIDEILAEDADFDDEPVTDADRTVPLRPDNLAYVIYTSGSTGVPKGVGVTHRNAAELFANTRPLFGFDTADVWTLFHSFAFDFSVWELWGALTTGGSVVVVDHATSRSPELFHQLLVRERVTVLNQTPSAFYQLADADADPTAGDLALRYVIFGGEALDPRKLRRWYDRRTGSSAPRLVNMYGITETTVHVSFLPLDETAAGTPGSPIGGPLPGLATPVLDARLHPAPFGAPGEIHVTGHQLSRGYLGRPGLTATRFVANPFGPSGSRMYRSGDIARLVRGGTAELPAADEPGCIDIGLAYLRRGDQQVQLRGFRIELGEVEAALLRCPGVRQAVATVHSATTVGERLIAYVVPTAGADLDPVDLRVRISDRLADYMVPAVVMVIDGLPLTPNGKLDRRALPAPQFRTHAYRAPATAVERTVTDIFAEVLGVDRYGMDDNFFEHGGNSLVAVKLTARLSEALGTRIPVMRVFSAPTPADLLAHTDGGSVDTEAAFDLLLPLRPAGSSAPLFCIHPVSGISWSYAGLAAYLPPDRPLYGLQTPALAVDAELPDSIETWATHYLELIRSVQPTGPYHLLAWSFGGVIAHEMAVQFQRAGEQVALIAVMDAYMHDPSGTLTSTVAGNAAQVPVAELLGGLLGEQAGDLGNLADLDWTTLPGLVAELPEPFASFGADRVARILDAAAHSVQLRSIYRPAVYRGDVVYFTAAVDDPTGCVGASLWAEIVDGTVHNVAVPTTHWRMTSASGLARIAEVLTVRWDTGLVDTGTAIAAINGE